MDVFWDCRQELYQLIFLNLKTPVPQMYKNGIAKRSHGDQQPGELLLHAKVMVTNALLFFPRYFALTSLTLLLFHPKEKGGKLQ